MKAIFLTPMFPPETDAERGGMHRRISATLQALAPRFDKIEMLHISAPGGVADSAKQSKFWKQDVATAVLPRHEQPPPFIDDHFRGLFDLSRQHPWHRYAGTQLQHTLQRHLATSPDLIVVDRLEPMVALRRCRTTSPILLDLNDIVHKVEKEALQSARPSLRTARTWALWPQLLRTERKFARMATRTTVCSEADVKYLRRMHFPGTIVCVPNAIAMPATPPPPAENLTVMFLGTMNYQPNQDAAERLVRRIWPQVLAAIPSARLLLAGPGSDTLPSSASKPPGVEYLGFTSSLPALYAQTQLVCCPLTAGGGTRLKLIEAAAYARPIVSTAKGSEGLGFVPGTHIVSAESDSQLADAVIALLKDPVRANRLAQAARDHVLAYFDEARIVAQIGHLVDELVPPR